MPPLLPVVRMVAHMRGGQMIPQFWQNYRDEIISLQIDRKVDGYAADQQ